MLIQAFLSSADEQLNVVVYKITEGERARLWGRGYEVSRAACERARFTRLGK